MSQESGNIVRHPGRLSEEERERHLKQKGCVVWFTGLSGAGKSTLARETELALIREGRPTAVLDGDNVRHGLNKDARLLMESPGYPEETARRFGLGFSAEDRTENIRRVGEVARLFADNNMIVLAAFISPFRRDRALVRALLPEGRFIEVHCAAPLSVCEGRDVKGLYKKARAGAIRDFTGITSPYEPPENPDLVAGAGKESPEQGVLKVMQLLRERGIVR